LPSIDYNAPPPDGAPPPPLRATRRQSVEQLDDVQRHSVMESVARGDITMGEAMALIQQFIAVERANTSPTKPPNSTRPDAEC